MGKIKKRTYTVRIKPRSHIANFVHDLRFGIITHKRILEEAKEWFISGNQERGMEILDAGIDHSTTLKKMASNYLDDLDVRTGQLKIRIEKLDLHKDLVGKFLEEHNHYIKAKDMCFEKTSVKPGEVILYSSRPLMEEIVFNNCGNIVNHGKEGTRFSVGAVKNVYSIDDEISSDGPYVNVIFWNVITEEDYHNRDNVKNGLGIGIIKEGTKILKGKYDDKFPYFYFDDEVKEFCARTKIMLPIDLRDFL